MAEAKDLTAGKWIVYNRSLYQVKRKENVAYGTHSHSKTKLFIVPLEGGGEKIITMMHHDKVEEADVVKKTGQILSKMPGKIQIMDPVSYETFDVEVEQELLDKVEEGSEVIFINYNGMVKILDKK